MDTQIGPYSETHENIPATFCSLNVMRGIAAFFIVVHHCTVYLLPQINDNLSQYSPFFVKNYLWVDFFFILTGFVLSYGYGQSFKLRISIKYYRYYLLKRLIRFYPLHIVTLTYLIGLELFRLILYKYGYTVAELCQAHKVPFTGRNSIESIFTNISLIQSFQSISTWNEPAWFISALMVVYVLIPVAIFLSNRISIQLNIFLLILAAVPLILLIWRNGTLDFLTYRSVVRALCDSFFGIFIFMIFDSGRVKILFKKKSVFYFLYVLTIVSLALPINHFFSIILFMLTILSATTASFYSDFMSNNRIFQYFGTISFSMFMVHWPMIQTIKLFSLSFSGKAFRFYYNKPHELIIIMVVLMGLVIVVSHLCYTYIERPLSSYFLKKIS